MPLCHGLCRRYLLFNIISLNATCLSHSTTRNLFPTLVLISPATNFESQKPYAWEILGLQLTTFFFFENIGASNHLVCFFVVLQVGVLIIYPSHMSHAHLPSHAGKVTVALDPTTRPCTKSSEQHTQPQICIYAYSSPVAFDGIGRDRSKYSPVDCGLVFFRTPWFALLL